MAEIEFNLVFLPSITNMDLLLKKYVLMEIFSFAGAGTLEMGIWLSTEVSDSKMIHF